MNSITVIFMLVIVQFSPNVFAGVKIVSGDGKFKQILADCAFSSVSMSSDYLKRLVNLAVIDDIPPPTMWNQLGSKLVVVGSDTVMLKDGDKIIKSDGNFAVKCCKALEEAEFYLSSCHNPYSVLVVDRGKKLVLGMCNSAFNIRPPPFETASNFIKVRDGLFQCRDTVMMASLAYGKRLAFQCEETFNRCTSLHGVFHPSSYCVHFIHSPEP